MNMQTMVQPMAERWDRWPARTVRVALLALLVALGSVLVAASPALAQSDDSNHAPVAADDSYTTNEDTTLNVAAPGVLSNDTDSDVPSFLYLGWATPPRDGELTFNSNGSFTYTPDKDFNGTDSFTYVAMDGYDESNVATVNITVKAVNDAPVATDDSVTTNEDTAITSIAVLSNDDVDGGDTLSVSGTTQPQNGTVTTNADGTINYTPDTNFFGTDKFTYTMRDGNGNTSTATVTVNVSEVNDAPLGSNDTLSSVLEDSGRRTIPFSTLLANDSPGPDNEATQTLQITSVSGATGGSATISGTDVLFTPAADFNGTAGFTYTLEDDGTTDGASRPQSATAQASFTVTPVNDAPSFTLPAEPDQTVNEDAGAQSVEGFAKNISGGPFNEATQKVSFTLSNGNTSLFTGQPQISSEGTLTYTPASNANGEATVKVSATDDGGTADGGKDTSAEQSFTITVGAVNDAPEAADDVSSYATDEDTELTVSAAEGVLSNDTDLDKDALRAQQVSEPSHGTLALNEDGSFTYMPDANFNGTDSFTYKASDGNLDSGVATVNIKVNAVNDKPVGTTDLKETPENTPLVLTHAELIHNDDVGAPNEGAQTLTITTVSDPKHGTVELDKPQSAQITFTPEAGYNGKEASFLYTLCDNGQPQPECSVEKVTVNVTVTEVNDPPVANADEIALGEDGEQVFDPTSNDSRGPANESEQNLKVDSIASQPTQGTATLITSGADTGKVSYKPSADYYGTDSFTYKVCDDGTTKGELDAKCDVGTVSVSVNPANDRPQATDTSFTMNEDAAPLTIDFSKLVSDVETSDSDLTYNVVVGSVRPNQGTLSGTGHSRTFDSADNFNGTVTISYTVTDRGDPDNCSATTQGGGGGEEACEAAKTSEQKKVSITVAPVNDAPVAKNDRYRIKDKGLYVPPSGVLKNDSDVDADQQLLSARMVSKTKHGRLVLREDGSFAYRPDKNYTGRDRFTYVVSDGAGGKDTATVILRVL